MADFNSSLPIRTENAGDVIAKIADATIPSQQLKVESDGSINVNSTLSATNLDIRDLVFATDKVDVSGSEVSLDSATLAALENITVSATNLDIRDLAFATDKVDASGSEVSLSSGTLAALESITVQNGAGASAVNIQDGGNSITVDGTVELGSTSLAALENITVSATDLDIRDLSHASDSIKVGDGTDFLAVNSDGSINVKISDSSPGTPINDYDTTASVAGGASDTHTYTSTGNFYLTQIDASASGKMKIEVRVNAVTKFIQFNSTSNPNLQIQLSQPILATSGQTVTIIRTNRDNQAQDVYSTISGYNE